MKRNTFLPQVAVVSSSVFLARDVLIFFNHDFPMVLMPNPRQKSTGQAVEKEITDFTFRVVNKELRWLLENCFPNQVRPQLIP